MKDFGGNEPNQFMYRRMTGWQENWWRNEDRMKRPNIKLLFLPVEKIWTLKKIKHTFGWEIFLGGYPDYLVGHLHKLTSTKENGNSFLIKTKIICNHNLTFLKKSSRSKLDICFFFVLFFAFDFNFYLNFLLGIQGESNIFL